MQSSSLVLAAVLAASAAPVWAVSTFNARMPAKAEDFAQASAKLDQRHHVPVRGQPSFTDLAADAASPPGIAVALEHAAPQARDHAPPLAIPEPQTWALMFAGLAALGFIVRRRR